MSKIVNKRNALLGWMTWKVGKGIAKKKARESLPVKSSHKGRSKKPAILAGAAAAVGGLLVLKKKGGHHHHDDSGSE